MSDWGEWWIEEIFIASDFDNISWLKSSICITDNLLGHGRVHASWGRSSWWEMLSKWPQEQKVVLKSPATEKPHLKHRFKQFKGLLLLDKLYFGPSNVMPSEEKHPTNFPNWPESFKLMQNKIKFTIYLPVNQIVTYFFEDRILVISKEWENGFASNMTH